MVIGRWSCLYSALNKRRRRAIFLRVICGLRKAYFEKKRVAFLTLTTALVNASYWVEDVYGGHWELLSDEDRMFACSRDWNIFLTTLKQQYPHCKIETFSEVTSEGNGVVHVLIVGLPYVYWGKLWRMWKQIHGEGFVWISKFRGSVDEMSKYLMSQYLCGQASLKLYFHMSQDWICPQFIKWWDVIKFYSRDFVLGRKNEFGNWYYPVNRAKLIDNFNDWLKYYIVNGTQVEYIPINCRRCTA